MFEYDYKCAIKSDNIHISLNNGPYQHIKKKPFILERLLQYSFVSWYLWSWGNNES